MGAIEVVDLAMAYGDVRAVDGVSFEVPEGEFFGILGPNGAGKTTTLEMIEGLRKPDAGTIRVLRESPWPRNPRLLPRIGVQLQASSFFERLTAREQIHTFASLYGVSGAQADEWLGRVGMEEKADTRVEKLSGGQSQRLSIACALVHDPEVVFLEPAAIRAQHEGLAHLRGGAWAASLAALERADSLQRDRKAAVFLGDLAGRRAYDLAQLRRWNDAERAARTALAAAREDVGARYVVALVLMGFSSVVPYIYFRRRGWL